MKDSFAFTRGMFETAIISGLLPSLTLKIAFLSGSSKHGNDFLALVLSNCVAATQEMFPSVLVYLVRKNPFKSSFKMATKSIEMT